MPITPLNLIKELIEGLDTWVSLQADPEVDLELWQKSCFLFKAFVARRDDELYFMNLLDGSDQNVLDIPLGKHADSKAALKAADDSLEALFRAGGYALSVAAKTEVRFIQITSGGIDHETRNEITYGLTAEGRVYWWHEEKQGWMPVAMRTIPGRS